MRGRIRRRLQGLFDPAWLTGPILDKELRVASRRQRQYVLRSLYILSLTAFAGVVWLSVVPQQAKGAFVQSVMAAAGQKIVMTVALFQFFAAQILAIVLLSGAISDEVYHRTLGILMTTSISSFQIVMGKLLSRLLQLVLLLAISLPMLAIVRVLGGVPWGYLLASLCLTLTAAVFAGSISLWFSIKHRAAYGVILRTLFALVCLYLILPMFFGAAAYYFLPKLGLTPNRLGAANLSGLRTLLNSLNPIAGMLAITQQMTSPRGVAWVSLPLHCGFMLGASALVLSWSAGVVRKVALRQAVGISDRRSRTAGSSPATNPQSDNSAKGGRLLPGVVPAIRNPQSSGIRRVAGPPVAWKELRAPFIQGINSRNSYIGFVVTVAALALTYWGSAYDGSLDDDFTHLAYVMLFLFIGGLINVVFAATRITTEKEAQSWSLLLATPLSEGEILLGKAVSAFRRCLPIWGLLAGHAVLFVLVGYIHWAVLLHLCLLVAWLTVFITGAGLYFSARLRRTTSAVVASFALLVGLWVVGPILGGIIGVRGGAGEWLAQYLWAHPVIQTHLIMTGGAGAQNAGMSWRSLSYGTRAVFHSGPEAMAAGMVTATLAGVAALYIGAGLLFFWRAKCCLRRRVFG